MKAQKGKLYLDLRKPQDLARVREMIGIAGTPAQKRDLAQAQKARRKNKYNAHPTECDNIRFASRREAARYRQLKLMLSAGEIRNLRLQVSFDLRVRRQKVTRYVADFVFLDKAGREVVEDCKGYRNKLYLLKKKLMRAIHGIEIQEV